TRGRPMPTASVETNGSPNPANLGEGRIWTATLTGGVALSPALRIDAGLTYNDGRIDEPTALLFERVFPLLDIPNFTGRFEDLPPRLLEHITEVPNVAKFSGRIGFDYRRPLGRDLELTAAGWANYVGRSRLGVGRQL